MHGLCQLMLALRQLMLVLCQLILDLCESMRSPMSADARP